MLYGVFDPVMFGWLHLVWLGHSLCKLQLRHACVCMHIRGWVKCHTPCKWNSMNRVRIKIYDDTKVNITESCFEIVIPVPMNIDF